MADRGTGNGGLTASPEEMSGNLDELPHRGGGWFTDIPNGPAIR